MENKIPKNIFIVGYTTLNEKEKKHADALIKSMKNKGHTVTVGI